MFATPGLATADGAGDWTFTITPYMWITGQEGRVATLPPAAPADVDISFTDVLENLDMTLMGFMEARKGRFGLFSEVLYLSVSAGADTPGSDYSGVDYEQDLWSVSLGGSYALTQDKDHHLDAVAGVRFWNIDNELELEAGTSPAAGTSDQESWHDYFVGFKGKTTLNDRWYLTGWGFVGVAGDSDSSWDVLGAAGYKYSDSLSLTAGYRHQEVDYENGDFLFDIKMSGPILGLVFRL